MSGGYEGQAERSKGDGKSTGDGKWEGGKWHSQGVGNGEISLGPGSLVGN